ncbi:2-dehydropantoate 2-reductase [Shimia sp. SDUM112013]|uniref:2-dehydropantoate 2-reductase n=1 Tax=Shimia sp. SDUM112013 TaxID=3136160 RepID=UPI0032EDFCB9
MSSAPKDSRPHVVIAGAGSVGCFVGGLLVRGAHRVTLLMRARLADEILRQGLTITDFQDLDEELSPDFFTISTTSECLKTADYILVTVKSGATETIAREIRTHAPKEAVVISLQNGVGNAEVLQKMLPDHDVRAGMVPFNVMSKGGGCFHRGTSGDIQISRGPGHVARFLSVPDLAFYERRNMAPVQWGKLLINLNNALNALSGLTLREQLTSMGWRRIMSDQLAEAVRVLEKAGIAAETPMSRRVPIRFVPKILRLPSPLFKRVARTMLTIDPYARSSMWEDLERGRLTEIEELQGVIVALAKEHGLKAPINARVAALIRDAEKAGRGSPKLVPKEIRA